MAELSIASQSSLLLPQFQSHITSTKASLCLINIRGLPSHHNPLSISKIKSLHRVPSPAFSHQPQQNRLFYNRISAVSDSTVSNLTTNPEIFEIDVKLDNSSGGGFGDGSSGGSGGGGGGGGGDDENGNGRDEGGDSPDESDGKRSNALSMSQKLTLAYAALVGFGGLMGFLKSGSQKSLAAGGISALILFYVYTQLPTKPVFASSIGLGMSAALLVVMGSRFKKSGKVFPAGVVSLVSLIMTGGYLHGVFRAAH